MDLSAILDDSSHGDGPTAEGETQEKVYTEVRQSHSGLLQLPAELYLPMISHLANKDIKRLRLSCKFFHHIARLRLRRVFLSARQRDIQVLRAIADSDAFHRDITELIWDDARFSLSPHLAQAHAEDEDDSSEEDDEDGGDGEAPPAWFTFACTTNVDELNSRKGMDADRLEHIARTQQVNARLSDAQCWQRYQELLREQDAVIASGADEDAFRYALQRFPSLKRITITPAAHGWLFTPLYETPTIRAFPYGFNYPIPRGWPTAPDNSPSPRMRPWVDGADEDYKNQWRGVRIALRVLAEAHTRHSITEFLLDAHHLDTGLNCRIFEHPSTNAEYANLRALLRRPGFARLDLALAVGGQEHTGWPALRGGHLRAALAEATGMRHFGLRTNVTRDPDARATVIGSGGHADHHVPLASIVPVGVWRALQHFGLSGFLVAQDDLMAFLRRLPDTLQSVELSFLHFLDEGGDYRSWLGAMRSTLGWQHLEEARRPAVVIGQDLIVPSGDGRAVWLDREVVGNFLYGNAPNMFGNDKGFAVNHVMMGPGVGVVRDAFDPSFERPYVNNATLMQLGVLKKASWMQ